MKTMQSNGQVTVTHEVTTGPRQRSFERSLLGPRQLTLASPEDLIRELLRRIGEDPERSGLVDTPDRVVRSWKELYSGYHETSQHILGRVFGDHEDYDEMIVVPDIEFYSMCEHHMMPFSGIVHIGYLPASGKIVGLSKIARLVEAYARRLQVQERMTKQIAVALSSAEIAPEKPLCSGVGVRISAKHMCMACRGVRKQKARMVTTTLLGTFREASTRMEFLDAIRPE
jgi:GTP cyclohydrolase I